MFFFLEEKDLMNHVIELFRYAGKGIFFVNAKSRTSLAELFYFKRLATLPFRYVLIDPRINWVTDFNTIYEQILFKLGRENITEVLRYFWDIRQKYGELSELTIVRLLLNIHRATEVEYTQKEILEISKNFLKILKLSNKNPNSVLYGMLKGHQKKKVVYLALLCSILFAAKKSKIIMFLENIDIALCATTHYLRTGIIIRFLSFLELTRCPVIVVFPCSEDIFKEYKEMYRWITSSKHEEIHRKARCVSCIHLEKIDAMRYRCPINKNLHDPHNLPPHFGKYCTLYSPKKEKQEYYN